jgi:hypothetical protein
MNIKLTVYLTAILAVAIVVVVFVINPKNINNIAGHVEVKRVFNINTLGNISSIDIQNENGEFALDKKAPGKWVITSPVDTDADISVVQTILSAFETLNYEKKIGKGALSAFGLSPAGITATVASSDNNVYSLKIGDAAPLGQYYYAMAGNGIPDIFTVTGWLRKQLDCTLFQLRNKSLVKFSQDDMASISFTKDSKPVYTLKKEKDGWTFTKPSLHRLKTSVFHDMAFQLTTMNATDIIDGAADLKQMGLEKPLGVISIVLMDNKRYSIKIGKNAGDNGIYAMVAGSPVVYVINKAVITVFETPIQKMYQK